MKRYSESALSQNEVASGSKPDLADILKMHIGDYRSRHKLHPDHFNVVSDIMKCRTPALGGHLHRCSNCYGEITLYNSCRNRHCPTCQTLTKAAWLEARKKELLPVPYVHSVFTLPHEINPVALCNKRVVYGMLFNAVSGTLLSFGKNPRNRLGGKIGIIAVLHTWTQKLEDHIHLHCVIPAGALSEDGERFTVSKNGFLFPVKALSKVFRGKFMALFKEAYAKGRLVFPGKTEHTGTPEGFADFEKKLRKKSWVVYSKKPFKGPEDVLGYIARYTHRVAISNHRIVSCRNGRVTFMYRNRKENKTCTETLHAEEFIRRFLLHVLPGKFMRIRHFGLFANRNRRKNIERCRTLLGLHGSIPFHPNPSVHEAMLTLTGKDILACPFCKKGKLAKVAVIPNDTGHCSFNLINSRCLKDSS